MKYESFKSIVLISLVVLSGFLTYKLWTFTPKIEKIDGSESGQNQEDPIILGETRNVPDLLTPKQIVMHREPSSYALLEKNQTKFKDVFEHVRGRKLSAVVDNLEQRPTEGIEIIFPAPIPPQFLFDQTSAEGLGLTLRNGVNRLFLYEGEDAENVFVQLADDESGQVETVATDIRRKELRKLLRDKEGKEVPAEVVKGDENTDVLLPARVYVSDKKIEMQEYKYYTLPLNGEEINSSREEIKNRLFGTEGIKPRKVGGATVYTDGRAFVTFDAENHFLTYESLIETKPDRDDALDAHILESSKNFVNLYGGWKNDYAIGTWQMNDNEGQAEFYLHVDNYPVFPLLKSEQMKVEVERIGTHVSHYGRPLVYLDQSIAREKQSMSAGVTVAEKLKQRADVDWEHVEDLQLGYDVDRESDASILFTPSWFYQYKGQWRLVNREKDVSR